MTAIDAEVSYGPGLHTRVLIDTARCEIVREEGSSGKALILLPGGNMLLDSYGTTVALNGSDKTVLIINEQYQGFIKRVTDQQMGYANYKLEGAITSSNKIAGTLKAS